MSYDRDSFLAGLAVGRTLWRPHTIAGADLIAVNCFACGQDYPLNWTYTDYTTGVHNFKSVNIAIQGYEQESVYWFVWNQIDANTAREHVDVVMIVPAGGWEPLVVGSYTFIMSGELDTGERLMAAAAGVRFVRHWSSMVARYRSAYGFELSDNYSPAMWKEAYRYFNGYSTQLTTYLNNAKMVGTGNNLFLLGEVT